jgi:DNA-formamidopyrimidine glycosylase
MPEGPEVKRMGRDLAEKISGKTLTEVSVISGRYTKKPILGAENMMGILPTKIIGVGVHGKFIYILSSSGVNIWNTLGMTGRWSSEKTKHARVKFSFSDSDPVFFEDIRNFGTLKYVYGKTKLIKKLEGLGVDLLAEDYHEDLFLEKIREKNEHNISKVLMNQKIFSGIGNYIKAESLWLAEIDPRKDVCQISDKKLKILCSAVKSILRESYNSGGATFKTHKSFSGKPGDYSSRFLCYGRKVDAEGNKVQKIKTPDGRTTHWAPNKQE